MQPFVNFATATNNISSSIDRPTTVLTLPPASSSIPMTVRNGPTLEQDGTEIEPLTKLFLKNMNNTIEQDYLGNYFSSENRLDLIEHVNIRKVCSV